MPEKVAVVDTFLKFAPAPPPQRGGCTTVQQIGVPQNVVLSAAWGVF